MRSGEVQDGKVATVEPFFVLGISYRSGTNYLARLLEQHPRISTGPVPEDFVAAKLPVLDDYVRRVTAEWNPRWGIEPNRARLIAGISDGLQGFLTSSSEPGTCYVLNRTPSVSGLAHLRKFFPMNRVIILVRDGRSVVESGMRSFDWRMDDAARTWANAAETIMKFRKEDARPERTMIVRYEDVVTDPVNTVQTLLDFLGLAMDEYPAGSAENVPVIGSSDLRRSGGHTRIHWDPTEQADFAPLRRHDQWSPGKHRRFDWIAGNALRELGYLPEPVPHSVPNSLIQRGKTMLDYCRPSALRLRLRRLIRGHPLR